MKTYKKVLCNANHIHRNIDKDLIFATRKYGGLEVPHLYDVMGMSKTKFLMKHLRLNDKTGKLLRISMEYTQLEVGTKVPFYHQSFDKWKHIITPTWITHLWQYWSEAAVQPDLTTMWTGKSERTNDDFLMDLLLKKFNTKTDHQKVNLCRMALQVINVADLANLNGTTILENMMEGTNYRKSEIKWPKSDIPKEWWKIWKTYVTSYIVPYIHNYPLGPLRSSHQIHQWKLYKNNLLASGRENEVYEMKKMKTRRKLFLKSDKIVSGVGKIVDVCKMGQGWQVVSGPMKEPFEEAMSEVLHLIPSQVLERKKKKKRKKDEKIRL